MKIQYYNVDELRPSPTNSNTHPEDQIQELAAMISEFGFLVPVIIDKDKFIVSGHGRVMAAIRLGFTQVPGIMADHLTGAQIKAFAIADNKVSKKSAFDLEMLAQEMDALLSENFDLALTGFSDAEISNLLQSVDDYTEAEQVRVREHHRRLEAKPIDIMETKKPVIFPGDFWKIGDSRLEVGFQDVAIIESMLSLWEKRTGKEACNQNLLTLNDLRNG